MGARAELNKVAFVAALAEDVKVWNALMKGGEIAEEHWKSIAPVGDTTHTLKSGFIVKPGDYQDSIRHRMIHAKDGPKVRVQAHDFKANWIEHGSIHNPNPTAPCAQTRAFMISRGYHA